MVTLLFDIAMAVTLIVMAFKKPASAEKLPAPTEKKEETSHAA